MNTKIEKVKTLGRLAKIEEIERLRELKDLLTNKYCSFKGVVFKSKEGERYSEKELIFNSILPYGFSSTIKNVALSSLDSKIRRLEKELSENSDL